MLFPNIYILNLYFLKKLTQIIPPPEWTPRRGGYDDVDITIPAPITQVVTGCQGLYQQFNVQKKAINCKDFEKLANSDRYELILFG